MKSKLFVASVALALVCLDSRATDLGTLGPTYEITEPHLLRMTSRVH